MTLISYDPQDHYRWRGFTGYFSEVGVQPPIIPSVYIFILNKIVMSKNTEHVGLLRVLDF